MNAAVFSPFSCVHVHESTLTTYGIMANKRDSFLRLLALGGGGRKKKIKTPNDQAESLLDVSVPMICVFLDLPRTKDERCACTFTVYL